MCDNVNMDEKIKAVIAAMQEIAAGAEEAAVKNMRPDFVKYGGNGDVVFIWGNEKKGIYHIGLRRGKEVVENVIKTVLFGQIDRYSAVKKTITLELNGYEAVISLDENGKPKTWLLTGWKKNEPDAAGKVSATTGATQTSPIFGRADLGAGTFSLR